MLTHRSLNDIVKKHIANRICFKMHAMPTRHGVHYLCKLNSRLRKQREWVPAVKCSPMHVLMNRFSHLLHRVSPIPRRFCTAPPHLSLTYPPRSDLPPFTSCPLPPLPSLTSHPHLYLTSPFLPLPPLSPLLSAPPS